ncbi:hypothetical protein BC829DRAFT_120320 [Chytridium lagenaria]|nr:hypothetical protein BC829DRAFT_120320 [Chytridium lagenaria]
MGSINYNPFTQSSEYTMPGPVEDSRWVSNVHNASTPLMAIPSHQLISDRFVAHPSMLHHHQALHPVDTHILPQPDPPMSGDHFFVPAHSMTSSTTVPIIVDTIPHGLVSMPTFGNEQYVFTQHGNTHATPPIMVPSDLPPAAWSPYAPPQVLDKFRTYTWEMEHATLFQVLLKDQTIVNVGDLIPSACPPFFWLCDVSVLLVGWPLWGPVLMIVSCIFILFFFLLMNFLENSVIASPARLVAF